MPSREWHHVAFPVATVLLAGFVLQHFILHPEEVGPPSFWPPEPDTAALENLALPRAVSFEIDTWDLEAVRLQALLRGHARLDASGLTLAFDGSPSMFRKNAMYPRTVTVESVTLALAEAHPTGWRLVAEGPEWIDRSQGPPGPAPSELRLPGVGAVDLADRWPVVVVVGLIDQPEVYELERMTFHVHGSRDVFDRLLYPNPADTGGR